MGAVPGAAVRAAGFWGIDSAARVECKGAVEGGGCGGEGERDWA